MKLLLLLLAFPIIGFGQNVSIPDPNFKAYLVGNSAINTNGDNQIQVSEASAFNGEIVCGYLNISNLTGIEAFTALTELYCAGNQLTSLDVSGCTALTSLLCHSNLLTSLDVSTCSALTVLGCSDNNLTSLDVSGCTALTSLLCQSNLLTSLDVSTCSALTVLVCRNNSLTSLDLSGCTALTYLDCTYNQLSCLNISNGNNINIFWNDEGYYDFHTYNNPNLSCIEVDDVAWSNANLANPNNIDSTASFSLNCNCSGAGISDINERNTLMIYPNPTNGDFTITGLELVGTVSSLSLTDMNGKAVKVLDTKATKFSMASIKPGVYFLNILSENKQEVLKIVKE
jgi:hypothetical protein